MRPHPNHRDSRIDVPPAASVHLHRQIKHARRRVTPKLAAATARGRAHRPTGVCAQIRIRVAAACRLGLPRVDFGREKRVRNLRHRGALRAR